MHILPQKKALHTLNIVIYYYTETNSTKPRMEALYQKKKTTHGPQNNKAQVQIYIFTYSTRKPQLQFTQILTYHHDHGFEYIDHTSSINYKKVQNTI